MPPLLKRRPTVSWFCAGAALSALCFWSLSSWFTIANDWLGLRTTYDTRPWWLVSAMTTASLLPWLVLGLVVLLRHWRGPAYRATAFGAGVVMPYLLAVGSLLLLPTLDDHWHRRGFDSALWKANQAADPLWPDRLCMVDDLLANVTFVGLPQAHVVELLGPVDKDRARNGWDMVYGLGPGRRAFRMDEESLAMRLSQDGRVVEYRILVD
ncbi:MAG: hypothetical protein GDA66_01845 [Nitrospira sp. CR1.2]|nr:hypothetical protein [Nitrospira sp. CR1.2]